MKNIVIAIVVLVVLTAGAWYVFSSGTNPNEESPESANAAVLVNGEEVAMTEVEAVKMQIAAGQGADVASLDAVALANLQTQAIDALIAQTLVRQSVKNSGVVVPQADVDAQINAIKEQLGDTAAFQAELTTQGLTEETLRARISDQLSTSLYLNQKLGLASVAATEEEIQSTYEQSVSGAEDAPNLEDVRSQVEAFVIQQKQQILIDQLIQQLRAGAEVEILI